MTVMGDFYKTFNDDQRLRLELLGCEAVYKIAKASGVIPGTNLFAMRAELARLRQQYREIRSMLK